jgi:hypothetical protein
MLVKTFYYIYIYILEMQKNEVSVLGVSEVRWKGQGEIRSGDYTVYYSDRSDKKTRKKT